MSCEPKNMQNDKKFRRFLAQFVATTIKNLFLLEMGFTLSLSTILIPALTKIPNEHNKDEYLTITAAQASWLSALGQLVQPLGCILSVPITDPLGRKMSMLLVNIPFGIGWLILYQSTAVWHIFVGFIILGLGIGAMEAPIMTYIGEICEPSFRGILMSYSLLFASFGMFLMFLLNSLMAWRIVCLMCLNVPLITLIAVLFIPETPQWLLSRNRTADAEKSLRWLRGWVSSESVAQEFYDLQRYIKRSKSCSVCFKTDLECTHPLPTLREKIAELKRKQTLKPFFIVISMFFLCQFSGIFSMKPFMVQIFTVYEIPIPADTAMTFMSVLDNFGIIIFIILLPFIGKRWQYLICIAIVLTCTSIITWYGFSYLPPGYTSFDQAERVPFHVENKNLPYIPMVCLFVWSFFSFVAIGSVPWFSLSELFCMKTRGVASGISAAVNYLFGFISKKTYYNLETTFSLPGISLFYACVSLFGLILMYNILPETENRTLEDIELHFSDNSKGLTDRNIAIRIRNGNDKNFNENGNEIEANATNEEFELEEKH